MKKYGYRGAFALFALLLAALSAANGANAADARGGVAVIERMYKDYAWEAIVAPREDAQSVFGKELQLQSQSVLEAYFDPALAALIVQDAACKKKTRSLCKLEFDIIFASSDPNAVNLRVREVAPDRVGVEVQYSSGGPTIELEYVMGTHAGQRRIVDVIYRSLGNVTLAGILQAH